MHMSWQELLFAHWPVDAATLRERIAASFGSVPPGLEIDTFEGACFLGVVPFRMAHTGLRFWPTRLGPHTFAELNVRTYVRCQGRPGVLFFSLDAASPLAVFTARRWFHLPYFIARMDLLPGSLTRYSSTRTHRGAPVAAFRATYAPAGPVYHSTAGSLEHWLTERYCLYSIGPRGSLWRGEIHHQPWPLQPATAEIQENSMASCHGITLPATPPILHYAKHIDVVAWAPERVPASHT